MMNARRADCIALHHTHAYGEGRLRSGRGGRDHLVQAAPLATVQTLRGSFSAGSKPIFQPSIPWKAFDDVYQITVFLHCSKREVSANARDNCSVQQQYFANSVASFDDVDTI